MTKIEIVVVVGRSKRKEEERGKSHIATVSPGGQSAA